MSPFMTTQILEPTHLSINSGGNGQRGGQGRAGDKPRGRSCEAIFASVWCCWSVEVDGKIGSRRLGTRKSAPRPSATPWGPCSEFISRLLFRLSPHCSHGARWRSHAQLAVPRRLPLPPPRAALWPEVRHSFAPPARARCVSRMSLPLECPRSSC